MKNSKLKEEREMRKEKPAIIPRPESCAKLPGHGKPSRLLFRSAFMQLFLFSLLICLLACSNPTGSGDEKDEATSPYSAYLSDEWLIFGESDPAPTLFIGGWVVITEDSLRKDDGDGDFFEMSITSWQELVNDGSGDRPDPAKYPSGYTLSGEVTDRTYYYEDMLPKADVFLSQDSKTVFIQFYDIEGYPDLWAYLYVDSGNDDPDPDPDPDSDPDPNPNPSSDPDPAYLSDEWLIFSDSDPYPYPTLYPSGWLTITEDSLRKDDGDGDFFEMSITSWQELVNDGSGDRPDPAEYPSGYTLSGEVTDRTEYYENIRPKADVFLSQDGKTMFIQFYDQDWNLYVWAYLYVEE